ncbi:MAG: twin-arginine translocase subunit TatC [Deltaproteobacteria bacterium]|nr:twin-arginine translocase subunit TatC [Deltaproteobacteria bacterium]
MKPLAEIFENRDQIIVFLEKLRRSLIQIAVVVFGLALAGYVLARDVLNFLQQHVGVTLAYYALTETFFALLSIALALSLIVSVPFILFKILAALQAVFHQFTRKMFFGFWFGFVFLFYAGASFCLLITLPYGAKFLLGFQNQSLEALISVRKFVSFCLTFILAFGVVFELPLIMILLGRIGLVPLTIFTRYRSYAILIIAILSAVLTPTPDALNMLLMAGPLYILYEIGIIGMRIWGPRPSSG